LSRRSATAARANDLAQESPGASLPRYVLGGPDAERPDEVVVEIACGQGRHRRSPVAIAAIAHT
jgi:hypothetical protein